MTLAACDFAIRRLGPPRHDSPRLELLAARPSTEHYVDEDDLVLFDDTASMRRNRVGEPPGFEPGGPRERIFFDPPRTRAAIVTCGGLCPGLNDVIRGLVRELSSYYGVCDVLGFREGYRGLTSAGLPPVPLTVESVADINVEGGTVLGTSRGAQDTSVILDRLEKLGVDILFVVGGDGTMSGAMRIAQAALERDLPIAVVGIPKTIDNDIPFIDESFGFQTAFARATESIRAVHVEAKATPGGVGLVKLMGRHSGFIACYAALAGGDADVVLIPEVPFSLEGPDGLLRLVERLVEHQGHAVVVAAEGAGQDLVAVSSNGSSAGGKDASGNARLHDIGPFLREQFGAHFAAAGREINLRYIDPSYAIRSVPANPYDSVYCVRLAHAAVHAAMAGRTEMVVGRWRRRFVHVPMTLTVSKRNQVDPHGDLWMSVLEATGQPVRMC